MDSGNPQSTTVTREQLYEEVWATPLTRLAPKYGVSSADLVRACEEHGIPRPGSGHWSLLKTGWKIEKSPLPPPSDPQRATVHLEHKPPAVKPPAPVIAVPARLSCPHPLVAAAQTMLTGRKPDARDGLVSSGGPTAVRIAVAPKNVGRALRIMDTIVKELEVRGFVLQREGAYDHAKVVLHKAGQQYPLKLREHVQRTELPLTAEHLKRWGYCSGDRYKFTPDSQLTVQFGEDYSPTLCQDTTNTRLEEKLGRFVERIVQRLAREEEESRRRAEENAVRHRALAEQKQKEEEAVRQRQEEQNRIADLNDQLARWRLSRDIREYLGELHRLMDAHEMRAAEGGPLARWLDWMAGYAQKIDPLCRLRRDMEAVRADLLRERVNGQPTGAAAESPPEPDPSAQPPAGESDPVAAARKT